MCSFEILWRLVLVLVADAGVTGIMKLVARVTKPVWLPACLLLDSLGAIRAL